MNKLIFIDIDGTIRDFDGYIPDSTIRAIRETRIKGNKVFLCTGRPLSQIDKEVLDIGVDGIVASSGSYIEIDGKIIDHTVFTKMTYLVLTTYLVEHDCAVQLQSYKDSYILNSQQDYFDELGEKLHDMFGGEKELVMPSTVVESPMDVDEIEKMIFFSEEISPERLKKKWGNDLNIVNLSIPVDATWAGEIGPKNINKAYGIEKVLESLGRDVKDTIAFGDSENDLEMIAFAHVGIAMGNAIEELKEIADFVTRPIRNDGLHSAFRALGVID
ncbi:MAG: HAD family hydrolase [Lachnospiraceae bacterium]